MVNENQEDFEKKKKITIICLSAALVFITLIAGLFLVKKNKESRYENNDFGEVVNENDSDNDNKKEKDKDKPKKIKNEDEKKSEEKNTADQKDENEDDQKETDDLPWLFTWKGAVIDLIISIIIVAIFKKIILTRYPDINKDCCSCTRILFHFLELLSFLFFILLFFHLSLLLKNTKTKVIGNVLNLFKKVFLV